MGERNLYQSNDKHLTYSGISIADEAVRNLLLLRRFLGLSTQSPKHGTAIASYLAEHLGVLCGFVTDQRIVNAFTAIGQILRQAFRSKSACY